MNIDITKEIRRAVDTGKVQFGEKQTEKSVLNGIGELIIVSSNVPTAKKEKTQHFAKLAEVQYFEFDGTGKKLGSVCGKPFMVSMMLIEDAGKSNILKTLTQTNKKTSKKKK
jgi:large subunit ribosomal protein L30e